MTDFEYLELVYKNNYEQLPCISSHISFFLYLHTPTTTPYLQLCHLPRHDPPWLTSKLRPSPRQKNKWTRKQSIWRFRQSNLILKFLKKIKIWESSEMMTNSLSSPPVFAGKFRHRQVEVRDDRTASLRHQLITTLLRRWPEIFFRRRPKTVLLWQSIEVEQESGAVVGLEMNLQQQEEKIMTLTIKLPNPNPKSEKQAKKQNRIQWIRAHQHSSLTSAARSQQVARSGPMAGWYCSIEAEPATTSRRRRRKIKTLVTIMRKPIRDRSNKRPITMDLSSKSTRCESPHVDVTCDCL